MKIKLFSFVIGFILTCFSFTAEGQYKKRDEVNLFGFNVLVGLNTTQVDGDFVKGYKKNGFYGGISGLLRFSKRSQVEIGLIYAQRGSKWDSEENGFQTRGEGILSMDMVEVPVIFKYYSKKEGNSVFWEGGFAIGQLIERSLDESFPDNRSPVIYAELDPFFKKQEVSIVFGIGVRIESILNVGLRFTSAISHIMDKHLPPVSAALFSNKREIGILRNYGFAIIASHEF